MNSNAQYEYIAEGSEKRNTSSSGGRGPPQVRPGIRNYSSSQTPDTSTKRDKCDFETQRTPKGSHKNGNEPTPTTDPSRDPQTREDIMMKCYPPRPRRRVEVCQEQPFWQSAEYVRDECGSGIMPHRVDYQSSRRQWCRTPLTSYQASHGELGRQILCGEQVIQRTIESGPPCNICEYVLPLCRGYYRKYECEKPPCEQEYWSYKKRPRDKVEKYWEPCQSSMERSDVNKFAPQNVALATHLRQKGKPTCW